MIKSFLKSLPGIKSLIAERDRLRQELNKMNASQSWPPGHYYSPIPDPEDVKGIRSRSGDRNVDELPGIDLRWGAQESLLREFSRFYDDLPFGDSKEDRGAHRYYFDNGFYSYTDGIMLYSVLRHLNPSRLIEIGSGFSSCLTLDVNEQFLDGSMNCTFIEPYPERLYENMGSADEHSATVLEQKVQQVDLGLFDALDENDILFIDSSHVGKAASDVNFLFFEVLPRLRRGVWIHVHDIFFPFEYPEEWILAGRSWNEAYMVRCLLMNSNAFEIQMWGDAMCARRKDLVESVMPKCVKNSGAGIWLRRV